MTKAVKKKGEKHRLSTSDKIDQIVTNRILALPIFAVVMFAVYWIAMGPFGTFLTDWTNDVLGTAWLVEIPRAALEGWGVNEVVVGLICDGALAGVINMVFHDGEPVNYMFFWLTGALSSFLDNAPTYLVFFNTAGGDPVHLMTDMAPTLAAISAGAVFMGANSYIGNAPNFMVRSIAEEQGVAMPSFFGYMAWSVGILIPLFLILTWLFFI